MKHDEADIRYLISKTRIPPGVKYTLVLVSVAKRMLASKIPNDFRLHYLQHLDKMVDMHTTAAVIAAVDPADDNGYELFREANKADPKKRLDMYAEIFAPMAVLNPSLITAIKLSPNCQAEHRSA